MPKNPKTVKEVRKELNEIIARLREHNLNLSALANERKEARDQALADVKELKAARLDLNGQLDQHRIQASVDAQKIAALEGMLTILEAIVFEKDEAGALTPRSETWDRLRERLEHGPDMMGYDTGRRPGR